MSDDADERDCITGLTEVCLASLHLSTSLIA
jgi:hypothetical protein